jgi:hypothetical protein
MSKPNSPGAVGAAGAEASARNCDGASCGRTNEGVGGFEKPKGGAVEADVD